MEFIVITPALRLIAHAVVVVMIGLLSNLAWSLTGGGVTGGGDDVALEFMEAALAAALYVQNHPESFPELSGVDLVSTVKNARITTSEEPLDVTSADGQKQISTAINNPSEQSIRVNRKRWSEVKSSASRKALALHEVLSLKYFEKTGQYPISVKYLIRLTLGDAAWRAVTGVGSTVPREDFRTSCRISFEDESRIIADCQDSRGSIVQNDFEKRGCASGLANVQGYLTCVRNTWALMPSGSYSRSCTSCRINDSTLTCICRNMNGENIQTSIQYRNCTHPLANTDGHLTCD